MDLRKLALACILFASPAFAQSLLSVDVEPVAVLEGASELTPFGGKTLIKSDGELKATPAALLTFVTTETASVSVLFETNDRVPVEAENEGRRYLITAGGRVWYYAVTVDIVDGRAVIEQKRGSFEVGPADPTDPPDPVPDALRDVSEKGARALADKDTTMNLIEKLKAAVDAARGAELVEAVTLLRHARERAFMQRAPTNTKDWLGIWLAPVNAEVRKLNITTTDQYINAFEAVITGLEDSLL